MDLQHMKLRDGLRAEPLGDEVVVFDSASGESIHRVSGVAVAALQAVLDGTDAPLGSDAAIADLVDAGILEDTTDLSRRKVLALGGKALVAGGVVWSAATVTSFKLANPAMAISHCAGGGENDYTKVHVYQASGTFKVASSPTALMVRAWGGGGGGGGAGWSLDGGGGGGGAFAGSDNVTVTACNTYAVVVGTAGTAGTSGGDLSAGGNGGDGGNSTFGGTLVLAAGGKGGKGATYGQYGAGGAGGLASASTGTTKWSGGNGHGVPGLGGSGAGGSGGGGGGGAGLTEAGHDGTDPAGGAGGAGNTDGSSNAGRGGRLSHSGDTSYSYIGYPAGGGGGGGDKVGTAYYLPGAGARGEVWCAYNWTYPQQIHT